MKNELAQMIDAGKDDKSILSSFVEKYGKQILVCASSYWIQSR